MFSELCSISALSGSFEFLVVVVGGGGVFQQLLCLNPTTVMVVLLLGCGCCWAVTIPFVILRFGELHFTLDNGYTDVLLPNLFLI